MIYFLIRPILKNIDKKNTYVIDNDESVCLAVTYRRLHKEMFYVMFFEIIKERVGSHCCQKLPAALFKVKNDIMDISGKV